MHLKVLYLQNRTIKPVANGAMVAVVASKLMGCRFDPWRCQVIFIVFSISLWLVPTLVTSGTVKCISYKAAESPIYNAIYICISMESVTSPSKCFAWHKHLKKNEAARGTLVTATTEVMFNTAVAIMTCDPQLSVWQLANILDISISSACMILSDCLRMSHNRSCIMTTCCLMLRMLFWNFWLKKTSRSYNTPHTVQISYYATSGCSRRQKRFERKTLSRWNGRT